VTQKQGAEENGTSRVMVLDVIPQVKTNSINYPITF
jgi:hypothetical protein